MRSYHTPDPIQSRAIFLVLHSPYVRPDLIPRLFIFTSPTAFGAKTFVTPWYLLPFCSPRFSTKMDFAFVAATPLPTRTTAAPSVCTSTPQPSTVAPTITMRCRRDLKKEKSLRNLEFARAHRKRVVRRYNRRAVQEAVQNEDNEYLSSIYGTLRFGTNAESSDK